MKRILLLLPAAVLFIILLRQLSQAQTICTQKFRGDSDCNGVIDLVDFEIFRKEFTGSLTTKSSDFDNNSQINLIDFEIWRGGYFNAPVSLSPTPTSAVGSTLHPQFGSSYYWPDKIPSPSAQALAIGVPECPSQMHDKTKWHPLYVPPNLITPQMKALLSTVDMTQTGCHYDHEHKDNPNYVDDVLGPAGAYANGQTISYPWQTFSASGVENDLKHKGYSWLVRKNASPAASGGSSVYIKDMRLVVHTDMPNLDAPVRYHSYWIEMNVCPVNSTNCGIARMGGFIDFGHLEVDGNVVHLPGEPSPIMDSLSRRIHFNPFGGQPHLQSLFFWYGHRFSPEYNYPKNGPISQLQIGVSSDDSWQGVDPNNPGNTPLRCGDKCEFNQSKYSMHLVVWSTRSGFSTNGRINYNGYTNRHGEPVTGCTQAGTDCVPLILENFPEGYGQYRDDRVGLETKYDYDTSPQGSGWIKPSKY